MSCVSWPEVPMGKCGSAESGLRSHLLERRFLPVKGTCRRCELPSRCSFQSIERWAPNLLSIYLRPRDAKGSNASIRPLPFA